MEAISSIPQMEPSKFEGILNSAMQVATPSCVVEQLRLLHSLPPPSLPGPADGRVPVQPGEDTAGIGRETVTADLLDQPFLTLYQSLHTMHCVCVCVHVRKTIHT